MAPLSFVPDAAGASLAAAALHLKPTSSTSPIQVVATVSHAVSSFAPARTTPSSSRWAASELPAGATGS